jgi:RNA polymerase sigma factor (sigma-70 family)
MQEHLSDKELIAQVLGGAQHAYATLVARYQNYIFTLVLRQVAVREEAEEVAQDVFVKAYRHLADFRGDSKFSTWLYQIVYTTCVSHHRKRKENLVAVEEDHMISIADRNGTADDTAHLHDKRIEKAMLTTAINQLPEQDGQVITLFYQHEQTIEEISTILGLTAANVKVKLFRSRQKLRTLLTGKYITELS